MIKASFFIRKCFRTLFSDLSDFQLLEDSYASIKKQDYVCPCCGQRCMFSNASPYSRSMISVKDNHRIETTILIRRLRCACGHCHAVIPEFLIPYGSYTIRFIFHVLRAYLNRTTTVSAFCDYWQLSVSTLYDWIHRFRDHVNLLNNIIKQIRWVTQAALDQVLDTPDFALTFLNSIPAFSFLEQHTTKSHLSTDSAIST